MTVKIQQIENTDISVIAPLWEKLKAHHQQRTTHFEDYYLGSTFAKREAELLAKEQLAIFLARSGKNNVGFCVASTVGAIGEVDSLYVDPDRRSYGIGTLLMQAGINWLGSFALDSIRLQVGEGNEEAISYYEQLGFKKRATMMQLLK